MGNEILVFAESREGKLHKTGQQLLSAAKKVQSELGGGDVIALALGTNIDEADLKALGKFGANKVFYCADEKLDLYSGEAFSRIIADKAKEISPRALLLAATAMGKDLAGKVAALLEQPLANDCTELIVADGKLKAKRPVYAGKAFITVVPKDMLVASLRPNVFPVEETQGEAALENFSAEIPSMRDKVKEIVKAASGKIDVAEASIIVTGGRGLGSPENFEKLIPPVAQALGAAIGASRAAVDAGWRPHAEQVGQTGKTVSPKLYIACGVSGAIQHLAGMSSSKCIVAINKDPDAPIFKVADYGIVGDVNEVLPVLAEELKKFLAE